MSNLHEHRLCKMKGIMGLSWFGSSKVKGSFCHVFGLFGMGFFCLVVFFKLGPLPHPGLNHSA